VAGAVDRHSRRWLAGTMTESIPALTDRPAGADEEAVEQGLADYNALKTGCRDWRPLAALIRDPNTGETPGGTIGRTSCGLRFIDLVYLPETVRGRDIGSRVIFTA
jgi:hypothetical protein